MGGGLDLRSVRQLRAGLQPLDRRLCLRLRRFLGITPPAGAVHRNETQARGRLEQGAVASLLRCHWRLRISVGPANPASICQYIFPAFLTVSLVLDPNFS